MNSHRLSESVLFLSLYLSREIERLEGELEAVGCVLQDNLINSDFLQNNFERDFNELRIEHATLKRIQSFIETELKLFALPKQKDED